jgi:dihydroflavonol-4-reductase
LKILLTGASGFVGSHILDSLRARGLATVLLLRPTSNTQFIAPHLPKVEQRPGSISDPESLPAMAGITHVIHCAGATKASRISGFYEVNQAGTRNVVNAVNAPRQVQVQRLVHISSLAAAGPAPARPRLAR